MQIFIQFEEKTEPTEEVQEVRHDAVIEHLNKSVDELELSVRSYNCLKNANIRTIGELVTRSEAEMLKRNVRDLTPWTDAGKRAIGQWLKGEAWLTSSSGTCSSPTARQTRQ